VLLGEMTRSYWFFLTAGSLIAFYLLLALTNINLEQRERALRFVFFIATVFLLAFAGNVVGLSWYHETAGPSGALYALEGLTYGFAILNAMVAGRKGVSFLRTSLRSIKNLLPFTFGLAIVIVLPIVATIDPVDFFTLSIRGVKVAGDVHLFCFFTGTIASLTFGLIRANLLQVRLSE
jgi:hypothetical protein